VLGMKPVEKYTAPSLAMYPLLISASSSTITPLSNSKTGNILQGFARLEKSTVTSSSSSHCLPCCRILRLLLCIRWGWKDFLKLCSAKHSTTLSLLPHGLLILSWNPTSTPLSNLGLEIYPRVLLRHEDHSNIAVSVSIFHFIVEFRHHSSEEVEDTGVSRRFTRLERAQQYLH